MSGWKQHKVPPMFKKHAGETLYIVYLNDPQYIKWVVENWEFRSGQEGEKAMFDDAYSYINEHCPEKLC